MTNANENAAKTIKALARRMMLDSISDDYVDRILNHYDETSEETFIDAVVRDVLETSAWEDEGHFNDDDVRLAIGREFVARLGIDE